MVKGVVTPRTTVNPMAPYFVQMREFERRLIRDAYEITGQNMALTADVLGVHIHYVKARAKLLGGVFNDEPKHEPPGPAAKAWNATSASSRQRKRLAAAKAAETTEPVEPDPVDKSVESVDEPSGADA